MECLQVRVDPFSTCFFIPLTVDELSQVRWGHIASNALSARRSAGVLPHCSRRHIVAAQSHHALPADLHRQKRAIVNLAMSVSQKPLPPLNLAV
jgi:hypothetical protein